MRNERTVVRGWAVMAVIASMSLVAWSCGFVTATRFWYQVPVHQDSPATRPVLAYDVETGTETQTGLTGNVWDVRLGPAG